MDSATINLIIQALTAAIPGALQIIHVFTQPNGDTVAVILERAKQTAEGDKSLIAAWNASHPKTQ
jgi:hypothetical protein